MATAEWSIALAQWDDAHTDGTGHYIGSDLTGYGFRYSPGEYVPVTVRYSAMLQWNWAFRVREMHAFQQAQG